MFVFPLAIDRVRLWRRLTLSFRFVFLLSFTTLIFFPKFPAIVLMETYSFLFHCPRKDGFGKKKKEEQEHMLSGH